MIHNTSSPYKHFKYHINFKKNIFNIKKKNQQKPFLPKPNINNKNQQLKLKKNQLKHINKKNPKKSKSNINYTFPKKNIIHTYYTIIFISIYSTIFKHIQILNIHNKSSINFI